MDPEITPNPDPEVEKTGLVSMAEKFSSLMSGVQKTGAPAAPPATPAPIPGKQAAASPDLKPPAQPQGEAPAAPEAAESDSIPDIIKTPKAAAEFRKIKQDRDEWKRKAELASAEAGGSQVAAEFEDLKKRYERVSEELRLSNIERHPTFVAHFEPKMKAAIDMAKRSVGPDLADSVERIIAMPESDAKMEEISSLMGELNDFQKHRLNLAISNYDELSESRRTEIEKARADAGAISASLSEQKAVESARSRKMLEDAVEATLANAGVLSGFSDKADASELEERRTFVRQFARGELPKEVYPWVPILAAEAMHLRETRLPELEKENAELKQQLSAFSASSPSPSGGSSSEPQAKSEGFIAKFKQNWPG